ncbi:MAG: LamG-like jellyroll fold domain-containing protein, partial [Anaerolineae bacterium]
MTSLRKWFSLGLLLILIAVSVVGTVPIAPAEVRASTLLEGQSLSLNGDGFVRVADHPELNPADAITIEAWVWRDSAARCETVVGKNYTEAYWLGFCNGPIRFYTAGSGTSVDGNSAIPARTWTHIAVTYDGVTRRYYVNGELDLTSTANNGPLADNDSDLGIGFDPETAFNQNNFDGFIDEVRLWNRVRTQAEIQADMRRELFGSDPGLIAYWRFNETTDDYDGAGHDDNGTLEGNAGFTPRGVLPRQTGFGATTATISVDGQCDATEYNLAALERSGFATVHMQHDADNVYVCFGGLEQGTSHAAHVLVDTDYSQSDPAGSGDYRFTLDIDGNTDAEEGNGSGGYTSFSPSAGAWEAAHHVDFEFTWSAEFRFSREILQLEPGWSQSLGLGFVEDRASKPDFSWPGGLIETQPSTWGLVYASSYERSGYTYDFDGYVQDEGTGTGIAGSTVQLFASTPAGTFLLETAATDSNGYFSFSHNSSIVATYLVQQQDLTGYTSVSANAGDDGHAVTPNVVRYDSLEEDHTYTTVTFLDTQARPTPRTFNRHYLIIYSPPVTYGDLWPLIEMKRLQGFQVTAETVQNIEAGTGGYDRAEKIRNWLRDQWLAHDPHPIYALLIGDSDVIPERQVGWEGDNAHRDPEVSPAYVTDWYYADLDSDDWDADGDGYYGEYLYCAPWEYKVPIAGADLPGRCPEEGSPLREGAYGTDPGPEDDWIAEIRIGRIMLNDRVEVRQALETIARSEASGDLAKREALLAGAMWYYYGNSWNGSAYDVGTGRQLRGAWPEDGNPPFGDDTAIQLETLVRPGIEPYVSNFFTLYEGISPGDDPDLIPTAQSFDLPLLKENVETAMTAQEYGLVNAIGHGNSVGIYHASWVRDYNDNGRIENPVNPDQADGCTSDCRELTGDRRFIHPDFLPESSSLAPVFVANACSTGDWIAGRNNIASRLLADGKAAAWMGALSVVPVHGVDAFQRDFNRDILVQPALLGDAAWGPTGQSHRTRWVYDWRMGTLQLFGDPAYAYWGNPADALAGWPQSGNDWWASGYTIDDGPASGGWVWTVGDHTPQSPPVVNREGYLLVGAEGRLVKFDPEGTQVDSVNLGVDVDYAPAVTTDGVYVVSGGTLYNFDETLTLREQLSLGGLANGAPRVGPEGTVWVPTTLGMARITGSGLPTILSSQGAATGHAAFLTNGTIWTTEQGLYGLFETPGTLKIGVPREIPGVTLTSPAVGPDETIYVGGDNGRLYAFDDLTDPAQWT